MNDSGNDAPWPQGYVQVYTGEGKGKTTAAIGLVVRAVGAGAKVFFAQFVKGRRYHEIAALERFGDAVRVRQYGHGKFIRGAPTPAECAAAQAGLAEVAGVLREGRRHLVVLDEANVAAKLGCFPAGALLELLDLRPPHVELVFTGRDADPALLARADLVTEMRAVRHYYDAGVDGRRGIES